MGSRFGVGATALLGLLAIGCGDDVSSDLSSATETGSSDDADTDAGPQVSTQGGAEGGTDDNDAGSTSGLTTDTGPTAGSGAETGTGSGFPEGDTDGFGEAECREIDCGDHGECELDEFGAASCSCDQGYASIGLSCVRCDEVTGAYSPDVPVTVADIELTIDGAAPPPSHSDDGDLYLRALDSPDEVWFGSTHRVNVSQTIVPGRYEVFYEFESGGMRVPVNQHARLGVYEFDNINAVKLELTTVVLKGSITINGGDAPNDPADTGYIELVNPATGDVARLGRTRDGEFQVRVLPGEYEVRYRVHQSSSVAPANTDVKLQDLNVSPDGPTEITVDVPSVAVQGQISLSNDPPPNDAADYGQIELRGANGDVVALSSTREPSYNMRLVPGEYEVIYRSVFSGAAAPANAHAVLGEKFVVPAQADEAEVNINIPTQRISGAIHVNEAPHSPDSGENGRIFLRDAEGDDEVFLGDTAAGIYAVTVIPGVYDVYYSQDSAGASLPVNTNARLPDTLNTDTANATVNIPVISVSGEFAIAGGAPPTSAYDDGRIYLRAPDGGTDSVLLGNTRVGTYSANIVPAAEYEVVYAAEFSEGEVPVNKSALIETTDAFSDGVAQGPYPINIPMAVLAGDVLLGGGAPPSGDGIGNVLLENVDGEDTIFLGHTSATEFMRAVTSGRYLVRYRGVPSADGQLSEDYPANTNAGVACIDVL